MIDRYAIEARAESQSPRLLGWYLVAMAKTLGGNDMFRALVADLGEYHAKRCVELVDSLENGARV